MGAVEHFFPQHFQFRQINIKKTGIARNVMYIRSVGYPVSNGNPSLSVCIHHCDVISSNTIPVGIERDLIT